MENRNQKEIHRENARAHGTRDALEISVMGLDRQPPQGTVLGVEGLVPSVADVDGFSLLSHSPFRWCHGQTDIFLSTHVESSFIYLGL